MGGRTNLEEGCRARIPMAVVQKAVIYQLVVRYFGNININNKKDGSLSEYGCGKFSDITVGALKSLRDLGVTHVWLTGCLRQATLTDYLALNLPGDDPDVVKGIAGSFYAVRDYFDVCPDYSLIPAQRMTEFEVLVGQIHQAGMKVLIDLVPNHVARGYQSVVKPAVLLFNGQEVGEPGAGIEGFSTDDGRTTAFDYWCMP